MPRAPQLEGPTVQTRGLPDGRLNVHYSTDDFGGQIANGLQNVGAATNQIYIRQQEQANQAAFNQASAKADELANNLQLAHRKAGGEDAVASLDDFKEQYKDGVAKIAGDTLSNDSQRDQFGQWQMHREVAFHGSIEQHAVSEGEKSYDLDAEARKQAAINRATLNSNDPEQVAQALADHLSASNAYAVHRGLSVEQTAALKSQDATQFWGAMVQTHMAAGEDIAAKRVFDEHAAEMDVSARNQLAGALDVSSTRAESQRQTAKIFAGERPLDDMLDEARKINDPKIQDATVQRIVSMHSLYNQAKEQRETALFGEGYKILSDPANDRGLDAIPTTLLTSLSPERAERLKQYARKDVVRVTDPAVLLGLEQMAARDPVEFAKPESVLKYMNVLSDSDFRHALSLQREAIQSGNKGPLIQGILSRDEVVNRALVSKGINPAPYTTKDGVVTANPDTIRFTAMADKAIIAEQTADPQHKPVSPSRVQEIVDKLLIEDTVKDPRGFFSNYIIHPFGDNFTERKVARFQTEGADKMAFSPSQVPPEEAAKIRDAASRAGRALSNDEMVDLYNANLRKQSNAGK